MKYIGDLSRADASLLEHYASEAKRVLEFGVGGSTQIIAQSMRDGAEFFSLDTDPAWIALTQRTLKRLGVEQRVQMTAYDEWDPARLDNLDLIFDDGADLLRKDFAFRSFPALKVGGVMLWHDTRRSQDIQNVLDFIAHHFNQISSISLNESGSNITVVRKKTAEPYVDWNLVEQRPSWAIGYGQVPEDFWG